MNEPERQEGVVAVLVRDDRFLLIQRAEGILAGGAWCFVGGAIERGESQREAVRREFFEEMGGHIEPCRKIWEWRRRDNRLWLHWWHCDLRAGTLRSNPAEVQDYGWFSLDEMLRLPRLLTSNREFALSMGWSLTVSKRDGDEK